MSVDLGGFGSNSNSTPAPSNIVTSSTPSKVVNECLFGLTSTDNMKKKDWGQCMFDDTQAVTLVTLLTTSLLLWIGWLIMKRRRVVLEKLRKTTHFLSPEDVIELQVHAPEFSETIIRKLFFRFMNLDWDRSGTLTCNEFCLMPELMCNPLSYRLFDAFDLNEDGHLDFAEFVGCVHTMSPLCSAQEKASAMFRIYDVDSDGIINRNDLTYILGSLTQRPRTKEELFNGVNLEETMEQHLDKEEEWDKFINSIVDEVMANSASDPDDQFMTIEDFMQSLATTQADFREKMNVPFRY